MIQDGYDLSALTDDELDGLLRRLEPKGAADHSQQFAVSAAKGLGETAAGLIDFAGFAVPGIERASAHEYAQGIRSYMEENLPDIPGLEGSLTADVGGGIGSGVGFIASGGTAGAAAKIFNAGPKVARFLSYAVPGGLGAALEAPGQFYEAEAAGASDTNKWLAFTGGLGIGATEVFGIGGILRRVDARSGGRLRQLLVDGVKESFEEGGQELLQNTLGNTLARYTYDEEREILEGSLRSATAGFLSGGLLSMAVSTSRGLGSGLEVVVDGEPDPDIIQDGGTFRASFIGSEGQLVEVEGATREAVQVEIDVARAEAEAVRQEMEGEQFLSNLSDEELEEFLSTAQSEEAPIETEEGTIGAALGLDDGVTDDTTPTEGVEKGSGGSGLIQEGISPSQSAPDRPAPEGAESVAAQVDAFNEGRIPAFFLPEGSAPVEGLEGAVVSTYDGGQIVHREGVDLAQATPETLGTFLGYGIAQKPADPAQVVIARDAQGRLIRGVVVPAEVPDSVIQAQTEAAGEGGTVETVSLEGSVALLDERAGTTPPRDGPNLTENSEKSPDFTSEAPGASDVATLPTEEGLFGEQERPAGPARDTTPTETVTEGALFDTQPGDLPGQTTISDLTEGESSGPLQGNLASGSEPSAPRTPSQEKREQYLVRVKEGRSGVVPMIQALGGISFDADAQAAIARGGGELKGLPRAVKREGKGGMNMDEVLDTLLEAGWFPGRGRQDVHPGEVLDLIELNPKHPDVIQEEAEKVTKGGGGGASVVDPNAAADALRAIARAQKEEDLRDIVDVESDGVPFFPSNAPEMIQPARPDDPVTGAQGPAVPIARNITARLEPSEEVKRGEGVSAPQVVQLLARIVEAAGRKVPIRWSRMGRVQAHGFFEVDPEVIRVKVANNIATAAHEVGHALEKVVYGWPKGGPWKNPRIAGRMQKELTFLGKRLYGSRKPAGGYKREGFAEFVRIYTTDNRSSLKKDAPLFLEWFEGTFLKEQPGVAEAVGRATDAATTWRKQGAQERARQSIVDTASPAERSRYRKREARKWASVQAWIEAAEPVRQFTEAAKKKLREQGRELPPSQDPYATISAMRTMNSARARVMVEDSMIDLAGNRTGPALADIRGLVKGKQSDFTIYLWAKRSLALLRDPNRPGRNPGLAAADAQQIIEELGSPEFEAAADRVYSWNDGVLEYAAQASGSFRRVVEKIREVDPGSYIPLQREFENLDMWARKQRNLGSGGSISKRLKGSGRRIKDPLQAMIANAESTILKAHQRMVLDQIIKLSALEGMGGLVVEVPVEQVPGAAESIDRIMKRINDKVFKETGALFTPTDESGNAVDIEDLGDAFSDVMGETLTFFTDAIQPKPGDNPILPVWTDGKVKWYEMDGDLHRTLSGMDVYRLPKVAEIFFGIPTSIFRAGTTGLRASFGLITNPMRDVSTLYANTRSSASAPRLAFEWLKLMGDSALKQASGGKLGNNPWLEAYVDRGLEMAQPLGQDIPHTRRAARRLFQGRRERILDPRNAYDFLRDFLQFPEAATRAVELKLVGKEIGWQPGEMMDMDQSIALINASKQVTTDFTAAGEFARMWNRIAPFHNAAIQGPRAHARALRRNPQRFVWRGLQLTAITLALWWRYRDEEWYQELPPEERFMYWHIPVDWPEPTLVRIPRAFELGAIFAAMPEAMFESAAQQDPELMGRWASHFLRVTAPNMTPVLLAEARDQLQNRDQFWDVPIVPMGELRRNPEEQYGEWTSYVSRSLGDIFGASPRRLDHAIGGIFGGVGRDVVRSIDDVLRAIGAVPEGQQRESELADIPVFGRVFKRGGKLGSRTESINKVYDLYSDAGRIQASERVEETEKQRELRLQLGDATKAITALSWIRSHTESNDARRALQQRVVDLAQKALDYHERGDVSRGLFRSERKKAEAEKEQ